MLLIKGQEKCIIKSVTMTETPFEPWAMNQFIVGDHFTLQDPGFD